MGSDTNTRAAAIEALGGLENARREILERRGGGRPHQVAIAAILDLALSALDGDGDARLLTAASVRGDAVHARRPNHRTALCGEENVSPVDDEFQPESVWSCRRCVRLLAQPEPEAPEPGRRGCGHRSPGECGIECSKVDMRGLHDKFTVTRNDGRDKHGEKHHGCDYFVLDLTHDEAAPAAIAAYAQAVEVTRPELAADLRKRFAIARPEAPEPATFREGALQGTPTRMTEGDRMEVDALKRRAFEAAQPAPEPGNHPVSPDGWEARIVEWMRVALGALADADRWFPPEKTVIGTDAERMVVTRGEIREAVGIMRYLTARAEKAEAEVERLTGVLDDLSNTEATNADTIDDLREKLADAQADVERLRGRDAEPFDWDAAPSVQEWIDENLPEREPRAGSKMVELHPDEVIADRGESRRVAGWLKDLMAENARLRAERDAAQENLAWAMKQRDAALAAQNARAGLLGRAVEAISECLPDEDLNDLSTHFHMECKRHHFERLKDVRDEMECALRAAKPEPAAEPVPAAADAKPGDEVLRRWIRLDGKKSPTEWLAAMSVVVDELCRRALEVRP